MKNTKSIGEISEAVILAHLLKKGWSVSIPFGNNQRYDMIVDNGEKLIKVQCKTSWFKSGCLQFQTSSKNGFTNVRTDYHGQIDVFVVYYPNLQTIYWVPVELTGINQMSLRLDFPKTNAATSKIKWAKDYQI